VEGKDDYPNETCAFSGERGWVNGPGKNLLAAMRNMTDALQDWDGEGEKSGSRTNEALKFLVHFYGDLHQPLHLAGRARGGNGINVRFDGRRTSESVVLK
jgi:S1/P1 Nuclease